MQIQITPSSHRRKRARHPLLPRPTGAGAVLRVYPRLIEAAFRSRSTDALFFWHEMRLADATGSGILALASTRAGRSRQTVQRLLSSGQNRWWQVNSGRVYVHAPDRAAHAFGLRSAGRGHEVPAAWLRLSKAMRLGAFALDALSRLAGGWPIAVEIMAKRLRVTPRTV